MGFGYKQWLNQTIVIVFRNRWGGRKLIYML